MNSLENVFANRAEKTSDSICETVRDTWPARRCNLHDGLENFDNLMESVYSVLPQEVLHGRVWEFSCRGLRSMSRKVAEEIARTWNRTYWGLARIDQDAIEIHQPLVPIR